jgi:hypothetical protein
VDTFSSSVGNLNRLTSKRIYFVIQNVFPIVKNNNVQFVADENNYFKKS